MIATISETIRRHLRSGDQNLRRGAGILRQRGPGRIQFWIIALFIGIAAGFAAVGFRSLILMLQQLIYGADDLGLASHAADLHWAKIIAIPVIGGLLVGAILHFLTPDGRARSVAHVIEGAALRDGRVELRAGLGAMLASLVTLCSGGSTGREGPVVHIGAMISSRISDMIHADGITGRELMGCAAAAAVSASFNAPIAGAIFAMEVVLRHYAIRAFAPIVIASVAGTVVSRLLVGDLTEFLLPTHSLEFYVELPAFMLLGLLCGLVASALIWGIFVAEDIGDKVQSALALPGWARPGVAGLMLGVLAVFYPHIIGVGYETTSLALTGTLLAGQAVAFALVKVLAVAITIGGRMGGGVFSPSLMLGALTGLAFGIIATSLFPSSSGTVGLYALAGMGGVAAAVLGAPISTTLIVFELTGDWQAGLAVMVAVSLSSSVCAGLVHRSFFLSQMARRGVRLAAGPQEYLMATISVGRVMRLSGDGSASVTQSTDLIAQGVFLLTDDTLEKALPMFDQAGVSFLPVLNALPDDAKNGETEQIGVLFHIDALKAYNRALAETAREEHS